MRTPIMLDVADITVRHPPSPGELLVVTLPVGLAQEEVEMLIHNVSSAIEGTGAVAVFLPASVRIEAHEAAEMAWLAAEGLALRGYPVPGGSEVRFRVLHPTRGQLSDSPSHLEAIKVARAACSAGAAIQGGPRRSPPRS